MTNQQTDASHAGCGAATCRWATPVLFLAAPYWWEAERAPWACLRDGTPRILTTTEECAGCPRWEPRKNTAAQAA